jgi:hypothetical protein
MADMDENPYNLPKPSSRIWSTYELAFVAVIAFALVGIVAGFVFTAQGVPLASPDPARGIRGAADSLSAASSDGTVRRGSLAPELDEGSGLAVSRRHEDLLWAHNDDPGPARLFALDLRGRLRGIFTVPGIRVRDFEDLGLGSCPDIDGAGEPGDCLYLADTGDNDRIRSEYAVFAVAEPEPSDGVAASGEAAILMGSLIYVYERGGPRDAEALAVAPGGRILVITKGQEGQADLFELSAEEFSPPSGSVGARIAAAAPAQARFLATLPVDVSDSRSRVTGAAVSPDGSTLAVRTPSAVYLFAMDRWNARPTVCAIGADEPQGEAVDFLDQSHLLLSGEAGFGPAPLLHLRCP